MVYMKREELVSEIRQLKKEVEYWKKRTEYWKTRATELQKSLGVEVIQRLKKIKEEKIRKA